MSYLNQRKIVLSVCDHSGNWSRGYAQAGFTVIRVDPKHDRSMDHGGLGYTSGVAGSGEITIMDDGGFGLGLTAGALHEALSKGWRCGLDPADALRAIFAGRGLGEAIPFGAEIDTILLAPPCTDFASSGARWFAAKDADGRTAQSVAIVRECLALVKLCNPRVWALENPVGRIARLVPELNDAPAKLVFDPCDYAGYADDTDAERYTKRTVIWGKFNADGMETAKVRVEPKMVELVRKDGTVTRGSWMWAKLGGKSERTKELRSVTPVGFARAFRWWN